MNGNEHYRRAEEFVERAETAATFDGALSFAATAQVHATLAAAAFGYYGAFQDPTAEVTP